MNLKKKKELAVRTLGIGKGRIIFNSQSINEIKEAITKQDIRELVAAGAIIIKDVKGRLKRVKGGRRRAGSIRKRTSGGKRSYVILVRKLRAYVVELLKQELITRDQYISLRKQIKAHSFKSKANLKEHLAVMQKEKNK